MRIELQHVDGRHALVAHGWKESPTTQRQWVSVELELLRQLGCMSVDSAPESVTVRPITGDLAWTRQEIASIERVLRGFSLALERDTHAQ